MNSATTRARDVHFANALRETMSALSDAVRDVFPNAAAVVTYDDSQMGDDLPVWDAKYVFDADGTEHELLNNDAVDEAEGLYYHLQGELTSLVDLFDGWSRTTRGRPLLEDGDQLALVRDDGTLPLLDSDDAATSDAIDSVVGTDPTVGASFMTSSPA